MIKKIDSNLFIGSLITSIIGGIMLLISDFAGWYNYTGSVRSWGWISLDLSAPVYSLIIIFLAASLFYCSYVSWLGIQTKNTDRTITHQQIKISLLLSVTVVAISLFSGVLFIIVMLMDEPTEWWLAEGFYGSVIGGGLTALFFSQIRNQMKSSQ